ncbi:immunoglobulin-like domain-containing protein [Rarobacter incanus]|uniref:Uncharacterized protein DUF5011 n=1 Tax=Rarobacter incanus TaxID=153494 RepID=A0A542SPL3_9MICO|nr:immunoglobulin-like domain-containing protein [Rarobacter incanus]TQK76561.1 uncharacterized protein DUF5011 [Rarobacter incanus]
MAAHVRRNVAAFASCTLLFGTLALGAPAQASEGQPSSNAAAVKETSAAQSVDPDEADPDGNALSDDSGVYWANKDYVEVPNSKTAKMSKKDLKKVQDTSDTITHKLRVVYFTKQGSEPSNPATDAQLKEFFETGSQSVSQYWQDQTNGAIKLVVQDITRLTMPSTYSCLNSGGDNSIDNLWSKAFSALGNPGDREHIMVVWPAISGTKCTYGLAGMPSNASLNNGGKVFAQFGSDGQEANLSRNAFSHEFGHNLGLGHSHGVYCKDGNGELDDNHECTYDEYGDFFDTMGRNDEGGIPQISTSAKDKLGVLGRTVTTVTATSGVRQYTLESLDYKPNKNVGDAGLESVKVVDPTTSRPYYIELRAASTDWRAPGYWSWKNSPGMAIPNTRVGMSDNGPRAGWPAAMTSDYGVRILRIGTSSSQGNNPLGSGRLGQNTITMENGTTVRNVWLPGEEFVTRSGQVKIKVISVSADKTSATVQVTLPQPTDKTAPAIYGADDGTIEAYSSFDSMAGLTARDDVDGDITEKMRVWGSVRVTVPGTYVLNYVVSDAAGNAATAERIIKVVDTTKATLQVPADTNVARGGTFDATAGVAAYDLVDGDLTAAVTASGTINTAAVGQYVVTYTVKDRAGNTTSATRTVRVVDPVTINVPAAAQGGDQQATGQSQTRTVKALEANLYQATYGQAAVIPVTITGGASSGNARVQATIGGKALQVSSVSQGSATISVPTGLRAGKHSVVITVTSDALAKPVTTTVNLKVAAATTNVAVKPKSKTWRAGKKTKLQIAVKAVGSVTPTGKVRVYVGKTRVATVKKVGVGKRTVTVKAAAIKRGWAGKKVAVTVTYTPSKNFVAATSSPVKVKVRK